AVWSQIVIGKGPWLIGIIKIDDSPGILQKARRFDQLCGCAPDGRDVLIYVDLHGGNQLVKVYAEGSSRSLVNEASDSWNDPLVECTERRSTCIHVSSMTLEKSSSGADWSHWLQRANRQRRNRSSMIRPRRLSIRAQLPGFNEIVH